MIQGHAFHAWVAPAHKADADYLFTRNFATLPLPAFLVLAGASVAYRAHGAARKGETSASLRLSLMRRGLQVVIAGYLVNFLYALMDGVDSWETLLRADVLQVIGLSIATLGLCAAGTSVVRPGRLMFHGLVTGVAVTLLCAPLSLWALSSLTGAPLLARAVLSAFVDVPNLTRMPYVPLFAWTAVGHAAGYWLAGAEVSVRRRQLWLLGFVAIFTTVLGHVATKWALDGAALSRTHDAVIWNVVEYAGRGLCVLGFGPLLVARLPAPAQRVFAQMGRASLWAYVFHIPFCYGHLGQQLYAKHSVLSALPYVLLLIAASYLVVRLRLAWPRLRWATGQVAKA